MPLITPKDKSKKAINQAVAKNIKELKTSAKHRPQKQIVAIAESAARKKK